MDYKRKIDFAIKLIRSIPADTDIEVAYSGGKDSDVILRLTQMAGIKYRAIYKNTTIDPKGTIAHARENGAEIVQPKISFFGLIQQKGYPNRYRRFCCEKLKEYKICDRAILGVRKEESTKRSLLYKEPEMCRNFGKEKVRQYYPILEWSLEDVARFIEEEKIKCAPVYYDNVGVFHPERRLGCLACPLASSKKRIEQFRENPKILAAWIKRGGQYLDTHPLTKASERFKDVYDMMLFNLMDCSLVEYQERTDGRMFGFDHKAAIERLTGIKLD